MASLDQFVIYFNDAFGRTIPNAKMFFYEAGSTTQKNTYTDIDLASTNEWPVIADGKGAFPPIFLESGAYRVIVQDGDGEQIYDRDNLNASESTVLTSSDLVFSNLVDAKQGILINGESINLQIGQNVTTLGLNAADDGQGGDWVVVAGGTGTPDDVNYANLDNSLQIKRLYNQLYTVNRLSEIASAGAAAQAEAQTNLGLDPDPVVNFTPSKLYYVNTDGEASGAVTIANASFPFPTGFISVRKTGQGGTITWPSLDSVPSEASYIDVIVFADTRDNVGGDSSGGIVNFKKGGSTVASPLAYRNQGAGGEREFSFSARIPYSDANGVDIEVLRFGGSDVWNVTLTLVGFGV